MYYSVGQTDEGTPPKTTGPVKPRPRFSTYLMATGAGLFLLGNLGFWIVRGKKDRKNIETFGKTVAIAGILARGVAEVTEYREKLS